MRFVATEKGFPRYPDRTLAPRRRRLPPTGTCEKTHSRFDFQKRRVLLLLSGAGLPTPRPQASFGTSPRILSQGRIDSERFVGVLGRDRVRRRRARARAALRLVLLLEVSRRLRAAPRPRREILVEDSRWVLRVCRRLSVHGCEDDLIGFWKRATGHVLSRGRWNDGS